MRAYQAALIAATACVITAGCGPRSSTSPDEPSSLGSAQAGKSSEQAEPAETEESLGPADEATDAAKSPTLDTGLEAVAARGLAAVAEETTLRTRTTTKINDHESVRISETIGQGAAVRERGFSESGCSEDPENRCPYDDYIHIGDDIYVYQGSGSWSADVIVPGIDRPDIDAFVGVRDMLDKLPRMLDAQSSGTVVSGVLRGDAGTSRVVVNFDSEGRPIECRLDSDPIFVTIEWSYDVDVPPIEPPV